MASYRKIETIARMERFDPKQLPWPDGVKPWPDERGVQPHDMSWGYIMTPEGKIHVQSGDCIITGDKGEHYACNYNDLPELIPVNWWRTN